jgi:raffinose/stachyose/melibiose transport system permease protein
MSQSIVVSPSVSSARIGRNRRFFRRKVLPWLFVLPILLLNALVVLGPSLSAFYYALTRWDGIGPATFIGLDNFRRMLFEDTSFGKAFLNNVIWMAIFLTIPMVLALVAASLAARVRRGGMFFRIALFIPYVLPAVITASVWRFLLNPTLGLGAQLAKIGLPGLDQAWLGRPDTALLAVAFVDNWHWWGFLMALFLAAMQSVPPELYESARIDGANRWDEFRHVTLPGIRPTLVFMIQMTAIWSFLAFDYVWILTRGGPAGSSEVLGVLVFKAAFNNLESGYAAAIGLTLSFFTTVIIAIFVVLRRRGWEI